MRPWDKTTMGGARSHFETTQWSEIIKVKIQDETQRRDILDNLTRKYWKPVYSYLRRKGYDNDAAKDLTQGFFVEVVLGKDLIQQADQTIGRFRTFLLAVLEKYLITVRRSQTRKKRHPQGNLFSLEGLDIPVLPLASKQMQPDDAYHYVWASELLDEVLAEVKRGCIRDQKQTHWELFQARVLDPIMNGDEPPSLRELCEGLGIDNEGVASNMIVTVKRRFKVTLGKYIRERIDTDEEVDQEIRDLMNILSKGCAR
ncbi:RNA polymerase sigma factor [Planctomycetota bacterium]